MATVQLSLPAYLCSNALILVLSRSLSLTMQHRILLVFRNTSIVKAPMLSHDMPEYTTVKQSTTSAFMLHP